MRLNSHISQADRGQIVRHFGEARLVKFSRGKYELIGGNAGDLTAAKEWVSLFAHEIVFTRV
jgi:hypothetical protein